MPVCIFLLTSTCATGALGRSGSRPYGPLRLPEGWFLTESRNSDFRGEDVNEELIREDDCQLEALVQRACANIGHIYMYTRIIRFELPTEQRA